MGYRYGEHHYGEGLYSRWPGWRPKVCNPEIWLPQVCKAPAWTPTVPDKPVWNPQVKRRV